MISRTSFTLTTRVCNVYRAVSGCHLQFLQPYAARYSTKYQYRQTPFPSTTVIAIRGNAWSLGTTIREKQIVFTNAIEIKIHQCHGEQGFDNE